VTHRSASDSFTTLALYKCIYLLTYLLTYLLIVKIGLKITYLNVINIQVPLGKILATDVLDQCLVDSKTILVGDLNGKKVACGAVEGQTNVEGCWKILWNCTTAHVY